MYRILLYVFLAQPLLLPAQEKILYDQDFRNLHKTATISGEISPDYLLAESDFLEISLTDQGYFTIGTTSGFSGSRLDDNCQLTFGHPYAMTSFPVFALDGNWYQFDDYFSQPDSVYLSKESSTIMFNGHEKNGMRITFGLVAKTQTAAVEFIVKISNTDTLPHTIAPGFFLDPALGKWGDGHFMNGSTVCSRDTVLTSEQLVSPLHIWEKNTGAKGIGCEITFTSGEPDKIILANWHDVYNDITPVFGQSTLRDIYDLVVKIYWPEIELGPATDYEIRWDLSLLDPDFSSKVFTRWDIPSYLYMDNGIMFPGEIRTTVEVNNSTDQAINNADLILNLPGSVTTNSESYDFTLEGEGTAYQSIILNANLIYEDRIVDIKTDIYHNGTIADRFVRKMFVPATPVSDTGLGLLNDSLSVSNFPEVEVIFSVENKTTGQRILDLGEDNIFLFENGARIRNFSLGKFSGGGSRLADVVFVLDVSGSMGDEKDQVVAYIEEFADSLAMRGFDYQVGLITFSTDIDRVVDLTSDVASVRQTLNSIALWGGVEDSPLALYTASELSFRPGSRRNIIWITDEPYPEHSYTVEQTVNRMLNMDITVHGVGLLSLQTDWFNPIVIPTGGNFYDISGNFRDILLDVTRMESQDRYLLNYTSDKSTGEDVTLIIEVHYAGLGVIKSYNFSPKTVMPVSYQLKCYPNPFNPEITLQIQKPPDLTGDISIYNVLGQRINKFELPPLASHQIIWDGRNIQGQQVGSGFYIVLLTIKDAQGIKHRESTRILHLK